MIFYIRKFLPSEILSQVGVVKSIITAATDRPINLSSLRLKTFKSHGTTCVNCGLEGTHFRLQSHSHKNGKGTSFHFGLWSDVDEFGNDYELTKDHIIPKSFGGFDSLKNMQPMCSKCNVKKNNTFDIEDFERGEGKYTFLQALVIKLNK